jgi:hypothetical protein
MIKLSFLYRNRECILKTGFAVIFILFFANCQSFEKKLSENNQLRLPIEDSVTVLTQHYPPDLNKIQVENSNKPFGKALEDELRIRGYAIQPKVKNEKKKESVILVDYLFDQMSPLTYRLRLSVGEKFYTYRLYELSENQLKPISPLSIEWRE